jgi:hypothetical protein
MVALVSAIQRRDEFLISRDQPVKNLFEKFPQVEQEVNIK